MKLDMQTFIDNALKAKRADDMKTSEQLTLGEMILLCKAIQDTELPVVFDDGKHVPTCIDSWRGSYAELALAYSYEDGSYDSDEVKEKSEWGTVYYKQIPTKFPQPVKLKDFLAKLEEVVGKTFTGYKGGSFTMGKNTPVWVADYGTSSGFIGDTQAVVGIEQKDSVVTIITKHIEY